MSLFNLFKKVEPQQKQQKSSNMDNTFFSMKSKKLPENFAQQLMDLQMRLEFSDTLDIQVIQQLNELYKVAIEYYANEDSRKASHFQKKLTNMLARPDTLNVISKKKKLQNCQQDLKSEINTFNSQSNIVIKSIIENSEKKIERTNKIINCQLATQQSRLNDRLQRRSRSKGNQL